MKNLQIESLHRERDFTEPNEYLFTRKHNSDGNNVALSLLLMCMTLPIFKGKQYFKLIHSSIASIVIIENFKFYVKDILSRMEILGVKRIIIIFITPNSDAENNKIDNRSIYNNKQETAEIKVIYILEEYFFSFDYLNELFKLYNEEPNHNILFCFSDLKWMRIAAKFMTVNIEVSGGSNSKKHMISPNQLKMVQLLTCLFGDSVKGIVSNSFHKRSKEEVMKVINYENPEVKEYINNTVGEKHSVNNDNKEVVDVLKKSLNNQNNNHKGFENNINKCSIRKFHTTIINSDITLYNKEPQTINQVSELKVSNENTLGIYLEKLKIIIENSKDTDETQKKIEAEWIKLIDIKLLNDNLVVQNYKGKIFSVLKEAFRTLNIWHENKYINKKFPLFKNELNKFEYLILTFTICLSYYKFMGYNAIVYKVGNDILYQIYKNRENSVLYYKDFKEFKEKLNITFKDITALGDIFVNFLIVFPHDIFQRELNPESFYTKETLKLKINENYINELRNNIIVNPTTIPMIAPPKIWSESTIGGYFSNTEKRESIITGSEHHDHYTENKEPLYEAINILNKTKFGINNLFLDYINNEGAYLLKINKEINEKQKDEETDDLQKMLTLKVAETFRNVPFYLTTHADWRGRIYTQSFFLSYQGSDLAKALLNFWEGEKVNIYQKKYLYYYGANSHNINNIGKKSYVDREKWVLQNWDKIINLDKELISSAENPCTFAAFCLNLKELNNNPNAIIKTPVFLDATCSGIQHLAAIIKDVELGSHVNLLESTDVDQPKDLYTWLLDPINLAINKYGEENINFRHFQDIQFDRKHIKHSIMTKVYNVTNFGITQQLKSKLEQKEELYEKIAEEIAEDLIIVRKNKKKDYYYAPTKLGLKVLLSAQDLSKIAQIINIQIFLNFPSLNNIYNYLINISKLMNKLDLPLNWTTTAGLNITQRYLKKKTIKIKLSLFQKTKTLIYKELTDKTDKSKQEQAIIPNVIHSLDASHLMKILIQGEKDQFGPIITVHDCFGTLPSKMEELDFRVKKEFLLLYIDGNFLFKFNERCLQTIRDNGIEIYSNSKDKKEYVITQNNKLLPIPTLPSIGSLDLEKITKAKYFIT